MGTGMNLYWLALGCNLGGPPDCVQMVTGMGRDSCFAAELKALPPTDVDAVLAKAQLIEDMMIQQEAVSTWITHNAPMLEPQTGTRVCKLLTTRDASYCLRRLSSPHLKRD
jgi:hypothetical protein